MTAEENKALVRRYLETIKKEVIKKRELALLDKFLATDYFNHWMEASGFKQPHLESAKQFWTVWLKAFPDYDFTVEDMIAEGDKVMIRSTERGTHKGEYAGIAPTGKKVKYASVNIYRIAGGKIVEEWALYDELSILQQLGVIPKK